jgi:hypothetical protein
VAATIVTSLVVMNVPLHEIRVTNAGSICCAEAFRRSRIETPADALKRRLPDSIRRLRSAISGADRSDGLAATSTSTFELVEQIDDRRRRSLPRFP